jgi:hypothetical protein
MVVLTSTQSVCERSFASAFYSALGVLSLRLSSYDALFCAHKM